MKKVNILETTLRDGSYAVNFSFTPADTEVVCKELESAGFEYIEIGHGQGLNASNAGCGKAVATDEEYLEAANTALSKAKFGMFCIPGIARLEDIDMAAKFGMRFIRIGTNVTQVEESEQFIKKAKDHGMFVCANYMKSYALPPKKFAEKIALSERYGVDMVYLVDSSGGMFPRDIENYFNEIRAVSEISLGFHGHDNLGMALANSLHAIDLGFDFVDSSLQGLGRGSGNACTELLVAALKKKGYPVALDLRKLFDIGQKYVVPIMNFVGRTPLDVISGYADFHSSYMHHILRYASKYRIDPILLILEVTKVDKVSVNDKMLEEVSKKIQKNEDLYVSKYGFSRYVGGEQDEMR